MGRYSRSRLGSWHSSTEVGLNRWDSSTRLGLGSQTRLVCRDNWIIWVQRINYNMRCNIRLRDMGMRIQGWKFRNNIGVWK